MKNDSVQTILNGPFIYNTSGELVFAGYGNTGGLIANNLKIAQYHGQAHLTFYQGDDELSGNRGHGVIMDRSYRTVNTVTPGLGRTSSDVHEFTLLEDGTALTTVYQPTQYDLTPYGVNVPIGWVIEGIFQHVDIETGNILFEWRSLDHTTPADSYTSVNVSSGEGTSASTAWDYLYLTNATPFLASQTK